MNGPTIHVEIVDAEHGHTITHGFTSDIDQAFDAIRCTSASRRHIGRIQFGDRDGEIFTPYLDDAMILVPTWSVQSDAA